MRVLVLLAALSTVSATASAPAWADDGSAPPRTFHKGQLGISARLGLGARGIVTYENTVYCGKTDPAAAHGFAVPDKV